MQSKSSEYFWESWESKKIIYKYIAISPVAAALVWSVDWGIHIKICFLEKTYTELRHEYEINPNHMY